MALRLKGSSSGYAEIDASADAGSVTLTLPATAGTINVKDASGNTSVGTGVNLGNPGPNIFTINTNGSERFRIAADGGVSIPGVLTYEDVTSVDAIGLSTFRDGLNTKDVGIATITSSDVNGATAVNVFVYDTSKDSDGGAWRKRTQHTSWYNETLGTATRGTRKEFPTVAVIVAEATKVTIYDGDDPDLPMWMEFDAGEQTANGKMLQFWGTATTGVVSSVTMLNGEMVVGTNNGSSSGIYVGITAVNFASDSAYYRRNSSDQYIIIGNSISDRNVNQYGGYATTGGLVGGNVNDVAITVLPNAPADSATGLPVPTIAVATDGGVSVIKDDGTVVDLNIVNRPYSSVDFTSDNLIFAVENPSGVDYDLMRYFEILSADRDNSNPPNTYGPSSLPALFPTNTKGNIFDSFAYGSPVGLSIIDHADGTASATNGMIAYVASEYNTGWMQGDIKGAFLSDTDTTNVTGTELITNGTFDSDTAWVVAPEFSDSQYAISGGTLRVDSNSTFGEVRTENSISLEVGKKYVFSTNVIGHTSNYYLMLSSSATDDDPNRTGLISISGTGSKSFTFIAPAATMWFYVACSNAGSDYVEIDNLSLRIAEGDRSVNNNGIQVFGEIHKTAVATAAELVGYGNFSASNNLVQPYNSDLNFGTGDFSFIAWIKKATLSTNHYVLDRNDGSGETDRFSFMINAAGKLNLYSGSTNAQAESAAIFAGSSAWRMVMVKRVGGAITFGLDGKEYVSTASVAGWDTTNITGSGNENLFIGQYGGGGAPGNVAYNVDYGIGEIANVRLSASAPSPEQFKKMYEDEKHLYQENAKCTLHGSSDAVTALGYDETTDQLHVGTSGGRSDFQGLRRINNTTTAVTTAISAHDTFIIEQ